MMPDNSFFKKAGSFTLQELSDIGGCEVFNPSDVDLSKRYDDVSTLKNATSTHVSFMHNKKYMDDFLNSQAGVCLVTLDLAQKAPAGRTLLLSKEPYRSYGQIAQAFYPKSIVKGILIDPKASVSATAHIGEGTRIDAAAVVGENVVLGKNCHVFPNAVIGDNVVFGDDCIVGANASVYYTIAGNQVYIYPGARLGQDGFGFFMSAKGHTKIPQLGRVIIGNDVEIGANTCIDRGALEDTIVQDGSRLDNLVQLGHNVQVGKCCVFVSQVGIAGSTEIGDFVVLGGQVGAAGHIKIGSGARIAGQSGLMRDVAPGEELMGCPAMPMKDFMRQTAMLKKMLKRKNNEDK